MGPLWGLSSCSTAPQDTRWWGQASSPAPGRGASLSGLQGPLCAEVRPTSLRCPGPAGTLGGAWCCHVDSVVSAEKVPWMPRPGWASVWAPAPGAGDPGGFTSVVWIQDPGAAPGPRPATDVAATSPRSPCCLSERLLFCICSLIQALSMRVASPNRRLHVPRILELNTEGQSASGPGACRGEAFYLYL